MIPRLVAMVLAGVLAAGCEATVATELTVSGPDTLTGKVVVSLTGPAAQAFGDDPELLVRLERLVADRTGATVRRERDDQALTVTADAPVERLTAAPGLTGLAAATITAAGDSRSSVRLAVVPPTELRAALEATEDPAAVEQLLANTSVQVRLTAGSIESATGLQPSQDPPVRIEYDDQSVTITRPVSSLAAGELTVTAAAAEPFPLVPAIVALVCLTLAVVFWRVRRPTRTGPGPRPRC